MQKTLLIVRGMFLMLSIVLMTSLVGIVMSDGWTVANLLSGVTLGTLLWGLCAGCDWLLKQTKWKNFNLFWMGLFVGQLMATSIWSLIAGALELKMLFSSAELVMLTKTVIYLAFSYLGITVTARAADQFELEIPFIRLTEMSSKKRDLILDGSVLLDSRIVEIASSGLLDGQLIVPQVVTKELYRMAESEDEATQSRGRRSLEVLKKLESVTTLNLRYTEKDFPELRSFTARLMELAQTLEANILTADAPRFHPYVTGNVRLVNIQMLSSAIKPITGDQLMVKVQRYGKEPRQGVGYLEDGTMVVVNGGAEHLGEVIRAHVLSIKHTASGRMIFCNVLDEMGEEARLGMRQGIAEVEEAKNYFTL